MNLQLTRELPNPDAIKALLPTTPELQAIKARRDEELKAILSGRDRRFLLIIGPCSADRQDAVLDYISRLRTVQEKVADKIYIVPRIYTNKPRTTGDGYKGMLHQPNPQEHSDMLRGLMSIRELHLKTLAETGFTCADEMLYPENHAYLDDLLGYVAVGARSVEDQQHRLTASGLNVPVGMKNPTSGDYTVMLNAIMAAQHSHTFVYRGWEATSQGNPYAHAILRGYVNKHGQSQPNYHYEELIRLHQLYAQKELQNMAVIIDCNHNNSGKQYLEQIRITREVLHSRRNNAELETMVKGIMIESYLEDGCQKISEGVYGKSITDPCLGWEKTEKLILEMADTL
ncbi:MAG: 3-deoxy-7-phosphoheptulonate synthase [Clostridiaceae bacterium]|nr:3-deoxy-7-phosphoheptulonate synthase [Clostridia bacterium]MDY3871168.1 3-deoxy-7-phosphoheptulonate synthase [Clostridiaceae bacterium]